MRKEDLVRFVESKIGQTISTIYGPSLVVGVVISDNGTRIVHLKEFDEEDYYLELKDFSYLLQA